jgi:hypothetical protein
MDRKIATTEFPAMRLPDFLVIGAMKSGTTTFYHDLANHPDIFLAEKESSALTRDVRPSEYARRFRGAKSHSLCGDISTTYGMFPHVPGVPERARRMLTKDAKIIYLVRDPVKRAISHHYHYHSLVGGDRMERDVDASVRRHAALIDYGRYAMQLEQWREEWELDAVRVIRFEDYVADRRGTLASVCGFLGIPVHPKWVDFSGAKNVSRGKPVLNQFWSSVVESGVYRRVVRACLSSATRERLRRLLLPEAPPPPPPPRPQTIERLVAVFSSDAERLQQLTGRTTPFWDFDAIRAHHIELHRQWNSSKPLHAA